MRAIRGASACLALLAWTGACASTGGPRGPLPTTGDRFFVAGYHPYWAGDAWEDYPYDALDRLYFFEIEAGPDGTLSNLHGWPDAWAPLLDHAAAEGVDLVPTLSMHNADDFVALFGSPERSERLVVEALSLLETTRGLTGLHLDFEVFTPVEQEVRDGYTGFVARLRNRMREADPSYTLSTFLLAFDDDDAYAERALVELVDYLVVQGYDFHSADGTAAGPVAPLSGWGRLNWTYVMERFLAFGVPPRKIVMAVPLYGYEWPTETDEPGSPTRGQAVEIALRPSPGVAPDLVRASDRTGLHGVRRDGASGSPYYVFDESGGWRQGWFEDEASLRAKYEFVRTHGLGGVALFPLAYGDEGLWEDLRASFRRPRD